MRQVLLIGSSLVNLEDPKCERKETLTLFYRLTRIQAQFLSPPSLAVEPIAI